MLRILVIVGAAVMLAGCSAHGSPAVAGETVSGSVSAAEQYSVGAPNPVGTESFPNPVPDMPDSDVATFCQGQAPSEGLKVSGTRGYYYYLTKNPISLDGRQVTVNDAQGKIVALTKTTYSGGDAGKPPASAGFGSASISCTWSFKISDLKSKSKFFTVEVDGVPGSRRVSRAELLAGLTLTVR